ALRLLRSGAEVLVTSRFPRDTARRYAQENDFELWCSRLHIFAVDLRQITRLESFVDYLYSHFSHIDILVNNAAQTVKRPPAYYAHLLPLETAPVDNLPHKWLPLLSEYDLNKPSVMTQIPFLAETDEKSYFPHDKYDSYGQQIDNRPYNSWIMSLDEISVAEILEVHLVNAVAPGVLAGQLKKLLQRSQHSDRFLVNVSAVEGQFTQFKRGIHPHTNMAKAALNMLTRSIAFDYAQSNIYVTSVDPGWVSDQVPRQDDESRNAAVEKITIDMVDATARICDPIFTGIKDGDFLSGKMFKDYQEVEW
ncbi:MAG: SDR family NAD(P)-dependent oxidoreductase, partial [Chitinophagaceae bacterium]|nr:SDR family NAD(P)-dependent oxidoreductase [Anaerolineae bacterium]